MDVLAILKHTIKEATNNKKHCMVAYLDLEGAYDCVWHEGLLKKIKAVGVEHYLYRWLTDYLRDRTVKVRVENQLSEKRILKRGVPQGAVLSPTLFKHLLLLAKIPLASKQKCKNI